MRFESGETQELEADYKESQGRNIADKEASATELPLTPEDIAEFREIVRAETGVLMDEGEAWNRATELIALVRMLIGPMPEDPES